MSSAICFNLDWSKILLSGNGLTHSLIHHFGTVPYSKKLEQDSYLINYWNVATKRFQNTDCIENSVEKGEIAKNEQFHLLPQCFPQAFFFNVFKMSIYGRKGYYTHIFTHDVLVVGQTGI